MRSTRAHTCGQNPLVMNIFLLAPVLLLNYVYAETFVFTAGTIVSSFVYGTQ